MEDQVGSPGVLYIVDEIDCLTDALNSVGDVI
jgi:hypothetical protein